MRAWTVDKDIEGSTPHRVYDLTIESLEERKIKSMVFKTVGKTAQYLGIQPNHLAEVRGIGKKYFSKKHGKHFAIRIETRG